MAVDRRPDSPRSRGAVFFENKLTSAGKSVFCKSVSVGPVGNQQGGAMKHLWVVAFVALLIGSCALIIGCESGGDDSDSDSSASTNTSSGPTAPTDDNTQLSESRKTLAPGETWQSGVVVAPGAGFIETFVVIAEDHLAVQTWLEDANVPGSRFDEKTGAMQTLRTATAAGQQWRTGAKNNLAVAFTIRVYMTYTAE
jgi:hypothetical protein